MVINDSGCRICRCRKKNENDTALTEKRAGSVCTVGNSKKKEGEMWKSGCHLCFCYSGSDETNVGSILCNLLECPSVSHCQSVVFPEDSCCPKCALEDELEEFFARATPTPVRLWSRTSVTCYFSKSATSSGWWTAKSGDQAKMIALFVVAWPLSSCALIMFARLLLAINLSSSLEGYSVA